MSNSLTQCVIEGHYLKLYRETAINAFDAKCERCGKIIHIHDATYFKRLNGEYNL